MRMRGLESYSEMNSLSEENCGILRKASTQEVEASGSGIQSQPYQVGRTS